METVATRVGIAGVGGRGSDFAALFAAMPDGLAEIRALCDTIPDALDEAATEIVRVQNGIAPGRFFDFSEMIASGALDAVIVATPVHLHAPMSIEALRTGLHVLCEVPAAVNEQEARELALSGEASQSIYAMAENYLYSRDNLMVREIAAAKLLGSPTYGRGEYLHELRELNEETPWRRRWQTGIRGITYPTHSLGPVLEWMGWNRVAAVLCEGTGTHHADPRGERYHDDSATMLCRIDPGALVEIRVDMISDRPHAMQNYELQGTDGVYESGRGAADDHGRIWLRALDSQPRWRPLNEAYEALRERGLVPAIEEAPADVGHGGGDFFALRDFLLAIREHREPRVGLHRALDLTLPGIASQTSIIKRSWVDVPDSREWVKTGVEPQTQIQMIWPRGRALERSSCDELQSQLPPGYDLGELQRDEREEYVELMQAAGFSDWTMERFAWVDQAVLPHGHFVIRRMTGNGGSRLVATALAAHRPTENHPAGGELGWVAADSAESGKGLGTIVCKAVVRRFLDAGYDRIYLTTNTFRLPALVVYLRLGFEPFIRDASEHDLWRDIQTALGELS